LPAKDEIMYEVFGEIKNLSDFGEIKSASRSDTEKSTCKLQVLFF